MTHNDLPASSGVSRRTVVRSAAWATPVIALAAAVPTAAASAIPASCTTVYFDSISAGCMPPANPDGTTQNYEYFVRLINTSGEVATFNTSSTLFNNGGLNDFAAYVDDGTGDFVTPYPWFRQVTLQPGAFLWFRIVMTSLAPPVREPIQATVSMHITFFTTPVVVCNPTITPLTFTPADSCPTTRTT